MDFATTAEIIGDAALELGINQAALANPWTSTDANIIQLLAFLKSEGRRLVRAFDWTQLQGEGNFSTVDGTAVYILPSTVRRSTNMTFWDRTNKRPLIGPLDPVRWEALKSGGLTGAVDTAYRFFGEQTWLYPTPSSVREIHYQYIFSTWVRSSNDSAGDGPSTSYPNSVEAGLDLPMLDSRLLTTAIKLAWLKAKGMPAQAAQDEYDEALVLATGSDGGKPAVNLSGRSEFKLLDTNNLPDTGWGT